MNYNIIIIGGGIAGLTASIYARRANKSVLILESTALGGQILQTLHISNYPALPDISGPDLIANTKAQAKSLGVNFKTEKALSIHRRTSTSTASSPKSSPITPLSNSTSLWEVKTDEENTYLARAIILATGTDYRHLNLPGESALIGRGISFCATCDGALYKNQPVAVYGGGNSALYSALYLSDLASKVYLIHRRDAFRADDALVKKASEKPNLEFVLNNTIKQLNPSNNDLEKPNPSPDDSLNNRNPSSSHLESLTLADEKILPVSALFVAIGRTPSNEQLLKNSPDLNVNLDDSGYILTTESCETTEPGIFAAGDCRSKSVRQIITAASDGAIAATSALNFLR